MTLAIICSNLCSKDQKRAIIKKIINISLMEQQPNMNSSGAGNATPTPQAGMKPNTAALLSYLLGYITGIIFLIMSKAYHMEKFKLPIVGDLAEKWTA